MWFSVFRKTKNLCFVTTDISRHTCFPVALLLSAARVEQNGIKIRQRGVLQAYEENLLNMGGETLFYLIFCPSSNVVKICGRCVCDVVASCSSAFTLVCLTGLKPGNFQYKCTLCFLLLLLSDHFSRWLCFCNEHIQTIWTYWFLLLPTLPNDPLRAHELVLNWF